MRKPINDDFISRNKGILWLSFFVIALVTFFPLFFAGFSTADDFHYYLVTRKGEVMEDCAFFAKVAGRFYFYIVKPFYNLPYLVDSPVYIKAFQFIPLLLCFIFFARIVRKVTGSRELAWLFMLLFFVTMQISKHTTLILAYPFYFTFSFLLLLGSYWMLLRYLEDHKVNRLVWSALLFAGGLLFYETYILYLVFAGVTIAYMDFTAERTLPARLKNALLHFLPFLAVGVVYLATYFIFRIYHPSQYAGTSFATKDVTFLSFLKVLWGLSYSSFPLTVYETSKTVFWDKSDLVGGFSPVVLRLILNARVEWLIKGVFVAFCGYYLLTSVPKLRVRALIAASVVALMLIFLPHIPLAVTEKYTFFVEKGGMIGYVTTFYSLFGTLLLLTIWIGYLTGLASPRPVFRRVVAGVLVFGFFLCSVITDFSNYMIAKDIRSANLRFYALDDLLKTDEFKSIPPQTPFYGRSLWDNPSYSAASLTEQDFNWVDYFSVRTGNTYPVGRDDQVFLAYSKRVPQTPWFIGARQAEKSDDVMLVLAKMKPLQQSDSVVDHFADRAMVAYYSPYKVFTVSFRVKDYPGGVKVPVVINRIRDSVFVNGTVEMNIFSVKKDHRTTIFTIQAPGIDLNSIMISNMVNPRNPYFYL